MSKYNPEVHHRRTIRLKDYDYSQEGMYFVTICTHNRKCILSEIKFTNVGAGFHARPENIKMIKYPIGEQIDKTINYINNNYNNVKIHDYIIMPNHFHGIININNKQGGHGNPPLHQIVGQLKSYTNKKYNEIKQTKNENIWQRNYYEHIIRNEKEYNIICEYIKNNPFNWENDQLNNL